MAEPKVSILLTLVDKMTAPVEGARSAIGKFGASIKDLGTEAMDLLNNELIQGIGFAGIVAGLGKSFDAADAFRVALQKLEGTAKITGIPIEYLTGIAEQATEQFKLLKTQAADFAVEMAKLASKAGDVGKAGPALQAFLDIGAARGLSAGETLKAVQQAILGIDEGTDKLFNANPSVLYKQFADAIGTTAAKLTDQQKAQALLTAAMTDGSKVMGTYQDYLASTAGQLEIAKNKTESAYATMGVALNDLRQSMASAIGFLAEKFTQFIGGIQILGADAALAILGVPARFKLAWGELVQAIANTMGESRILMTIFGDGLTDIAKKMGASGDRMVTESRKNLRDLKAGHDEVVAGVVAVVGAGEQKQADLANAGAKARKKTAEEEAAALKEAKKKSNVELAKLQALYDAQSLATLEAQHVGYAELVKQFQAKMQGMDVEDKAKAQEILDKHGSRLIDIWNKNYGSMAPVMIKYSQAIKGVTTSFEDMPARSEPALQLFPRIQKFAGEMGPAFQQAARDIGDMASALGMSSPELEKVVGGVMRLGDGLKSLASGDTIGAITGGIAGLSAILGGFFGDSPEAQARKALLQKNTDRLAELKDRLGEVLNLSTPGGKVAALTGIDPTELIAGSAPGGTRGAGRLVSRTKLAEFLLDKGLSLTDFLQIASDLGYGDLGKNGNYFDADAISSFFEAVKGGRKTGFSDTLTGDLAGLDLTNGATGGGSSGFLSGLAGILGGKNGSDALGGLFSGVNLSDGIDAGEIATIRGRTTGLATRFANGQVTSAELGGANNAEFIRIIELILSKLDDIAGATTATADGVAGGAMATTVGVQTADSSAMTGFNTGRV